MSTTNDNKELIDLPEELWEEMATQSKSPNGQSYTPYQKVLAVQCFYDTGNAAEVSRELNIKAATIRTWKKQPWWDGVRKAIVKLNNESISVILTDTALNAALQLRDLVKNGEPLFDKRGEPVKDTEGNQIRLPLNAQTLSINGLSIAVDKAMKLDMNNNVQNKTLTVQDAMKGLKDTFLEMVDQERKENEPILINQEDITEVT